jgi:hypothetical protein
VSQAAALGYGVKRAFGPQLSFFEHIPEQVVSLELLNRFSANLRRFQISAVGQGAANRLNTQ